MTDTFNSFCYTAHRFFDSRTPVSSAGNGEIILVDLLHGNPGYLLRSLLIAAYLRLVTGRDLIGLVGRPGVVEQSCGPFDIARNRALAEAFGVSSFWEIEPANAVDRLEALRLLDEVERTRPDRSDVAFRRALMAMRRTDGLSIGRFIYDTCIRTTLNATIDPLDGGLIDSAADVVAVERQFRARLADCRTRAPMFVTGHLDYDPWGLMAELIGIFHGDVYHFTTETSFSVVRVPPASGDRESLQGALADIEAEWFGRQVLPHMGDWSDELAAFEVLNRQRIFHSSWTSRLRPDPSPGIAGAAARECKALRGWDPATPVVAIFAHALGDQPVGTRTVYEDRYTWLSETVAFAACHDERNWIIKIHPADRTYDRSGASEKLIARYGHLRHLWFVTEPLSMALMVSLADIGTTISGTPGLQFPSAGRPMICAGRARYADLGFVRRAETEADYQALLLADPGALALTDHEIAVAQLYEYALQLRCAHYHAVLVNELDVTASDAYWENLDRRLRHHDIGSDELFAALTRLVDDGEHRSMPPAPSSRARSAPGARSAGEPVLTSENPLQFHIDGNATSCLLFGFEVPERLGTWTLKTVAVVAVKLRVPAIWTTVTLRIDCESFHDASLQILHQGAVISPRKRDGVSVYDFALPEPDAEGQRALAISLRCGRLASPKEIGISQDNRKLGVQLQKMEIVGGQPQGPTQENM